MAATRKIALTERDVAKRQRALAQQALHREHLALRSSAVTYSADKQYYVSIAQDGSAVLYETKDGVTQKNSVSLKGDASPVTFTGFSPDSRWIVVAHQSGIVYLYNTPRGQEIHTFQGHIGPVRKAAFSPDGRLLATASDDGTAKVWDVASGKLRHTLGNVGNSQNAPPMIGVQFSPDGATLSTTDTRGATTTWDTRTGRPLRAVA